MEKKIPVGKIDFLDTNGKVGETCYYYTEEEFLKSVKHENYYGAPMVVTVFRDENGQTIPLDFMKDFDPYPQGFRIIDYEEGENLNEFQKLERLAKQYKALYPQGTRIELVMMGSDPRPIEPGTRGTVDHVDDLSTIHCTFDNGRRLGIIPEEDSFRKLTQEELLEEKSIKLQGAYVEKINKEVIPCIEWVGMKNAYKNGDMAVPGDLLKMLHEKFVEVYGSDHIEESMGMLTVPGVVRANDGNTYVALLIIDAESAGEHWGTTFFTPKGVLSDQSDDKNILAEIKKFVPYQYWYTPEFDHDCHVNWDNMDDTAERWRDLVRAHIDEIAEQHQIPLRDLEWYGAFHNESNHPHIHLLLYSRSEQDKGYITKTGIDNLRRMFGTAIFADEIHQLYDEQTERRNKLNSESIDEFNELCMMVEQGLCTNPKIVKMVTDLSDRLKTVKGKKQYGYLPKSVKAMVDGIVDELEEDDRIKRLYDLWYECKCLIYQT